MLIRICPKKITQRFHLEFQSAVQRPQDKKVVFEILEPEDSWTCAFVDVWNREKSYAR